QAPSLHLSLTVILWATYSQHLHGGMLWLMRGWMILMGASTLTTYQHHFIDIPTGIWVGLLCIAMFRADPAASRRETVSDPRRIQLGAVYLLGCIVLSAVAAC